MMVSRVLNVGEGRWMARFRKRRLSNRNLGLRCILEDASLELLDFMLDGFGLSADLFCNLHGFGDLAVKRITLGVQFQH